jgi:hypothetical protein
MRVRIIASKPKHPGESDITSMVGVECTVIGKTAVGVIVNIGPTGMNLYDDEYEVVEQKETQQPSTL